MAFLQQFEQPTWRNVAGHFPLPEGRRPSVARDLSESVSPGTVAFDCDHLDAFSAIWSRRLLKNTFAPDEKHLCLLSDRGFKGRNKFVVDGCVHDSESLADYARSVLEVLKVGIILGTGRV